MTGLDDRLARLDVTLFDAIHSQSTAGDKQSWLALQHAIRQMKPSYTYLEIGSYLGGSIQPHLRDPRCSLIYSIDKRPAEQPDDRGPRFSYRDASTCQMLANLRAIDARQVRKMVCFDADAKDVNRLAIRSAPHLCLIDGEHTRAAVLDDFAFCDSVSAPDAVIGFHDADVIYPAIADIVRMLSRQGVPFRTVKLGGSTFAIARGWGRVIDHPRVRDVVEEDGEAFLRRMRARRRRERIGRLIPSFLKPALRTLRPA